MSSGLSDQLHGVPLERENQDLKEIIEIAFQITAQLEIENVIKNVVWSFVSKFQIDSASFALPGEMDEDAVQVISYKGVKREDLGLSLPSHGYHSRNEHFDWRQASGGIRMFLHYFAEIARIRPPRRRRWGKG